MPILPEVVERHAVITAWRHDLHQNPELGFDLDRTVGLIAARLEEFGCDEVITGFGKSGIVAIIKGKGQPKNGNPKVIGLRCDMDALAIDESTNLTYSSKNSGSMHACGHDGHSAMLLGAAQYLAETRNFAGTVVLIFEPAEEVGTGARAMLDDGLMDRFEIEQVFGLHNLPGLPVGTFGVRQGPALGATDSVEITIEGSGGHPGTPHKCVDAMLAGAQLLTAFQQIVSQNINPLESAAISFHEFHCGTTQPVVAQRAELKGTIRTLKSDVRDAVHARMQKVANGIATVTGASIDLKIEGVDAVVFNHTTPTEHARRAAKEISDAVVETAPILIGEDFSYFARARPGVFVWCGNGDSASLHHATYDFNDQVILYGTSYWIKLVENTL
ncbi:amidohydrolase [Mesorhizobium sp.]|uniref:amidohydrolase n=1 Tax=Mesorhizobium sp. TaxID=1871066 RepID=UPI0011FE0C29|nr:amidohydrolase [Mesorhizobium sp.]TIL44437.1 MAG: amidohydrolase [Mesorhizobium sp.]